jgi:hypothetical protein
MRRWLIVLGVIAVLCAGASVACIPLAVHFVTSSGLYDAAQSSGGLATQEAANLADIGFILVQLAAPLAAAAALTLVAILAVLTVRRDVRPAPAP